MSVLTSYPSSPMYVDYTNSNDPRYNLATSIPTLFTSNSTKREVSIEFTTKIKSPGSAPRS